MRLDYLHSNIYWKVSLKVIKYTPGETRKLLKYR